MPNSLSAVLVLSSKSIDDYYRGLNWDKVQVGMVLSAF